MPTLEAHVLFPIGLENTNLEDVEILLPVKFYHMPFSGFRTLVKIVKVNDKRTNGQTRDNV